MHLLQPGPDRVGTRAYAGKLREGSAGKTVD